MKEKYTTPFVHEPMMKIAYALVSAGKGLTRPYPACCVGNGKPPGAWRAWNDIFPIIHKHLRMRYTQNVANNYLAV